MIDLTRARDRVILRLAQHFLDLGAAFDRDRLDPFLAEPFAVLREAFAANRKIADDALVVKNEGNVGGRDQQTRGAVCIHCADRFFGRVKMGQEISPATKQECVTQRKRPG